MKMMVTRIYEKCGPGQEIGLQAFDMEIDNVMTSAEIDSIIEKLTALKKEMPRGATKKENEIGNELIIEEEAKLL